MKLQPLVSWWLLLPYLLATVGYIGWQYWQIRRNRKLRKLPKDKKNTWQWVRRAILLVLPAIIALGPSVQGGVSSPGVANLDVIFAVDTTPSMAALDYNGKQQRIEGARNDLLALASSLQGAHFEIVSFNSEASVVLPLTTDATAFSTAVQGLTPQINSYSKGSTIDKPIKLLSQELKNIQNAYPEHYRMLFYLGDGEQTAQSQVKTFAPIAGYLTGGAVMGYGTAKGAQMIKYTGLENTGSAPPASFVTTVDETSNKLGPAISHTDTAALKKISTQLKVTYQDRNLGGPVSDLYQASKAALAVDRSQRVIHYLNLYWLFAIPYAGLIFWEWQALIVKLFDLRERHREHHAK